jgi:hypothetical protein
MPIGLATIARHFRSCLSSASRSTIVPVTIESNSPCIERRFFRARARKDRTTSSGTFRSVIVLPIASRCSQNDCTSTKERSSRVSGESCSGQLYPPWGALGGRRRGLHAVGNDLDAVYALGKCVADSCDAAGTEGATDIFFAQVSFGP